MVPLGPFTTDTSIAGADKLDVVQSHVHNLLTPCSITYFNTIDDPYQKGMDFAKGLYTSFFEFSPS